MPNRIIASSICASDSLSELSWFEQVLFLRLIVSADDFGRYDARPKIIRGHLFPLEDVTEKNVQNALTRLSTNGLISLYSVAGRPLLELCAWRKYNTPRAKESKYPGPDESDSTCTQMQADENKCNHVQADVPDIRIRNSIFDIRDSGGENACASAPAPAQETPETGFGPVLQAAFDDWVAYKRELRKLYKPVGLRNLVSEIRNNAQTYGEDAVASLIRVCISSGYQGIIFDRLSKQNTPAQSYGKKQVPYGSGELGDAELEAIQRLMQGGSV